jgi:hypothetical protein
MFIFKIKIAIYFSLGLYEGSTSYMKSIQLAKENIQHFKSKRFFTFFLFCVGIFAYLDLDPADLCQCGIHEDPDPQHWFRGPILLVIWSRI